MRVDRLGRARQPGQERGLRAPHPELPEEWVSKAVRIAMPQADWDRLETLASRLGDGEPTHARALGAAIARLLDQGRPSASDSAAVSHWMDWERRKAMRLLRLAV